MASDPYDLSADLAGLQPPREVRLGLRCRLLSGPLVLIAAGIFAFGMAFALALGGGTSPADPWLLDLRHREAPGWLEAVEQTNFREGGGDDPGVPILRYEFSFEAPNGQRLRGRSYATSLPVTLPKGPLDPNRRPDLVIEYDPDRPTRNRIRGARIGPFGKAVLFILPFPAVALFVVAWGVRSGWRKLRLLREGTPALATMTACVMAGEDSIEMPVAEYKRLMAGPRVPGMGAALAFAKTFRLVWLVGVVAILIFGLVTIVGGLVFLAFAPRNGADALPMLFGFLGFGVVWVATGAFMLRAGSAGLWGRKAPAGWRTRCVFEFRPPEGEPVRVKGTELLRPDESAEPPRTVLYDPADPRHAALLSQIAPGLAFSQSGGWEAPGALVALVRLAAVVLLIAGPPLAWFLLSAMP